MRQAGAVLALVCASTLFADANQAVLVKISSLEGPRLDVQLRPKDVLFVKKGDPPAPVYQGIDGAALVFEVVFDRLKKKENVAVLDVQPLENLARADDKAGRPPMVHVSWGDGMAFKGVLESVSVRYTMFSDQGIPVRATANVRLREAGRLAPRECRANEDCPAGQVCADPDGESRRSCVTPPK